MIIRKIAIIGGPNVGKSVLFNVLTKKYVTVSNYPGTTVEVSRGKTDIGGMEYEVIDTPGMYSFLPLTEDEKVARDILLKENPYIVIHVIDAKNLERMLPLTMQLIEASFAVILALNIMDEAKKEKVFINAGLLEKELRVPVVEMVATHGEGIDDLKKRIKGYAEGLQRAG